jgi:nucleoside-diphosphate-sugar epimerase
MAPLYALLEAIPATRDGAVRLGLVTLEQMARALLWAVENPPAQTRILDVPAIRAISG